MTQGKLRRALWICDYFPRPHDMTTGTWALESVAAIGAAGLPVAVMAPTPWIPRALAANQSTGARCEGSLDCDAGEMLRCGSA